MDVGFKTSAMNGFDATRRIKEANPATNVIIMTASDDESALVAGVEAGAAGFLNKTEAVDEVLAAVRGAADGEVLIDPALLARALQHVAKDREARRQADQLLGQLTDREMEVLRLLAQGNRNDGDRRTAVHQPADRADARPQHPGQAPGALEARGRLLRRPLRRRPGLNRPHPTLSTSDSFRSGW